MIDITTEAIRLTHPEAVCIRWDRICYDKNSQQISIDDEIVDAKIIELTAEYDAQEYARNRQVEYPSLLELTVALYDTDDKAALATKRAAVKTKWPKNNTGPVE